MNYIEDQALGTISDSYKQIEGLIKMMYSGEISFEEAKNRCVSISGSSDILETFVKQAQSVVPDAYASVQSSGIMAGFRKKAQRWTQDEDQRLIEAINQLGVENWNAVAMQVGGGRTKAQCAQRWNRCLNPAVSKKNWDRAEEEKLIQAVQNYGDKSWTKIAAEMKTRSDVQCRFRYKFLLKKQKEYHFDTIRPIAPDMITVDPVVDTIGIIDSVTGVNLNKNEED